MATFVDLLSNQLAHEHIIKILQEENLFLLLILIKDNKWRWNISTEIGGSFYNLFWLIWYMYYPSLWQCRSDASDFKGSTNHNMKHTIALLRVKNSVVRLQCLLINEWSKIQSFRIDNYIYWVRLSVLWYLNSSIVGYFDISTNNGI